MSSTRVPAVSDQGVARPVSRPGDAAEREADRAADVVVSGGSLGDWSLATSPPGSGVQRQDGPGTEDTKDKASDDPNRKEYEEAAKKTGEALLKTEAGKALQKQVLESPEVKKVTKFATSPAGIAIGATAIAGGVTGLALAGKELPFQPPTIPLDRITPGLSADLQVTGPLNAPTFVGLTITFTPKAKPSPSRRRSEGDTSGQGPLAPRRTSGEEQRLSEAAIDYAVQQMTARHPLGVPVMKLDLSPRATRQDADERPGPAAPAQRATTRSLDHAPGVARVDDGFAGPGRPLDDGVRSTMETRFGHDFSTVRLHDDARAVAAADRVQARAFTVGDDIVLGAGGDASSPHLLAHELAHVVQQHGGAGGEAIHRYTAYDDTAQADGSSRGWTHPDGSTGLRVADDGQAVVEDNGWGEGRNKRGWSTPRLVADANGALDAQGSHAKLRERPGGARIGGGPPNGGTATTLVEIEPFTPGGGPFNLASDCGTAARQVMGSGPSGKDVATLARPADPGSAGTGGAIAGGILGGLLGGGVGAGIGIGIGSIFGPIGMLVGGIVGGLGGIIGGAIGGAKLGRHLAKRAPTPGKEEYLAPRDYHGGNPTTPEEWSEELFQRDLGASTRQEAYANYARLSASERDEFDRAHGINAYAVPRVGQGLTVSTEKDMPGFRVHPGMEEDTWNFHYAATVLVTGQDYVTLENAAGWDPFTGWIFYMYGPRTKGQSFHEEQGDTRTHGTEHTTFVVQPEATLDVVTTAASTTLDTTAGSVSLPVGTPLRIVERLPSGDGERLLVRVTAGDHANTVGRVRAGDVQ